MKKVNKGGKFNYNITYGLTYRFIFCTRNRRKIFDDLGKKVFNNSLQQCCEKNGIHIIEVTNDKYFADLTLECPPELSPQEIMKIVKRDTGKALIKNLPILKNTVSIWTMSFLVSTDLDLPNGTIISFLTEQKRVRNRKEQVV